MTLCGKILEILANSKGMTLVDIYDAVIKSGYQIKLVPDSTAPIQAIVAQAVVALRRNGAIVMEQSLWKLTPNRN